MKSYENSRQICTDPAQTFPFHLQWGGDAKSYLETFDIQVFLSLSGHFQPRIQSFHQWFCITDILQVPVGPKIQHFHGLGDVLYLLNGERILTLDWQNPSDHCLDHFMESKKASSNPRTQTTLTSKKFCMVMDEGAFLNPIILEQMYWWFPLDLTTDVLLGTNAS